MDTGQSDILVLADVPLPPEIEIGLNMNAIGTKIISREVIKYILPIYPPLPLPLSDSMPEQETGEFQFQMDIWTRTPSTTLFQPKRDEMLIFGLLSTSDDRLGWSMDSNPIHHPSAAKKNEMLIFGLHSTSDDWPGWSKDSNPIHHPSPAKKMKCSFLDYVQLLVIGWAG